MKNIFIIILLLLCSCTKENYIDTGISNGKHDCTMYDYFKKDSYNWDSTVLVIKRADLMHVFDGSDSKYRNITFFGPVNHSIRRYILEKKYKCVNDIPVETCRELMMRHVAIKKYMKEDIAFSVPDITGVINGGTLIECEGGNTLHAYNLQDSYGGVAGAGPVFLRLYSVDKKATVPMASPNIETTTGVVHALNGSFTFGNL